MALGPLSGFDRARVRYGFSSREEAENTTVADRGAIISYLKNGVRCYFEADNEASALQTADGGWWRPLRGVPTFLEHYGVTTSRNVEIRTQDYGREWQLAMDETEGTLLVTGWAKTNRQLNGRVNCVLDTIFAPASGTPTEWGGGGIQVDPSFNFSATGVLVGPASSRGWTIKNLGINFDQYAAWNGGDRGLLLQYPRAIDVSNVVTRSNFGHIRIEGAWDGIVGEGTFPLGNCGGADWDLLEISAFNDGVRINGAKDYMHTKTIAGWPFGLIYYERDKLRPDYDGTNPNLNLMNIYMDGDSIVLRLGLVDGWRCDALSTFESQVIIEHTEANKLLWLPYQFGMIQMDGGKGHFTLRSGNVTAGSFVTPTKVFVEGGNFVMKNTISYGGAAPNIKQTGGNVVLDGYFLTRSASSTILEVTGGVAHISGLADCHVNTRSAPMLKQSGTGVLKSRLLAAPTVSGAVPFIEVGTDLAANDIECPRYYSMSKPALAPLGRYKQLTGID